MHRRLVIRPADAICKISNETLAVAPRPAPDYLKSSCLKEVPHSVLGPSVEIVRMCMNFQKKRSTDNKLSAWPQHFKDVRSGQIWSRNVLKDLFCNYEVECRLRERAFANIVRGEIRRLVGLEIIPPPRPRTADFQNIERRTIQTSYKPINLTIHNDTAPLCAFSRLNPFAQTGTNTHRKKRPYERTRRSRSIHRNK